LDFRAVFFFATFFTVFVFFFIAVFFSRRLPVPVKVSLSCSHASMLRSNIWRRMLCVDLKSRPPVRGSIIQQRTNDINATIASVATANNAILIDVHAIFEDIKAHGYTVGGITFTNALLQGGLFSADGFHPSNIAHAIIADEIIKAINRVNNANIPEVNFTAAFFTPNVPPAAATALSANDFWRSIFAMFPPDMDVILPTEERSAPIVPTRPSRGTRGSMIKRADLIP